VRELESRQPPKEDEPAQPHPDLVKADARIEALKARDDGLQKRQTAAIEAVNEADRQLAIAKYERGRIRPDDDDKADKERLADRLIADRQRDLEMATERFNGVRDDRAELREKMDQAKADRDWIQRFQADQADKHKTEQTTREQFNEEFPRHVDALILKAAKATGIDIKDKTLRASVVRNVNRDLMIELQSLGNVDLRQVDLRGLVRGFVRSYAVDRDLAKRKAFNRASRDKLTVARPSSGDRRAPTTPVKPAGSSKPVPVSLMGGNSTDKMLQARQRLVQKFG
jgi:hypothetical protein